MSTTLEDMTVGQLVVDRPARARVFERFGIDYCCGGKKPLRQACQDRGVDVGAVVTELVQDETTSHAAGERSWATASMTDLCDHIEATHHTYLRQELPRLAFLTHKVAGRHGDHRPELVEIHEVFMAMKAELESHMMKEEQVLFPVCRLLDTAEELPPTHCGSVDNPIRVMIQEHQDAGDALARFRELSNDYTPPADACTTYRALFDSLHQLERDMHQHVHKENNILFPKAARAERVLSRAKAGRDKTGRQQEAAR